MKPSLTETMTSRNGTLPRDCEKTNKEIKKKYAILISRVTLITKKD